MELGKNHTFPFCKYCLTPVKKGHVNCINCNLDLSIEKNTVLKTESQFTGAKRIHCKHCGRPVMKAAPKCFVCLKEL